MFCLWLNASICGLYNANRFGRKHFGKIGTTFQRNNQFPFTFKQAIFISTQRKRELMKVTNIKDFTEATTAGVVE